MEPSNGMEPNITSTKCVPWLYYGDKYEVDPKLGCKFELKPTSFQNLLWFMCLCKVFGKIILYVSATQILKQNMFS